jgi:hypothetical protein
VPGWGRQVAVILQQMLVFLRIHASSSRFRGLCVWTGQVSVWQGFTLP